MKAAILLLLLLATMHLAAQSDSLQTKLVRYKDLYTKGLIDSAEYKALKEKTLGLYPTFIRQTQHTNRSTDSLGWTATQLYDSGRRDAEVYYKCPPGVALGTFFTSLAGGPLLGLIPAIACPSKAPPRDKMINKYPSLLDSPDYIMGYTYQTKKKKRQNAWGSWAGGVVVDAFISLIVATHYR